MPSGNEDVSIWIRLRNARRFQQEAKSTAASVSAVGAAADKSAVSAGRLSTSLKTLETTGVSSLTVLENKTLSFKKNLDLVSRPFLVGGGIAAAATAVSGRAILNFEQQFNQVRAWSAAFTKEQHENLRQQALDLGLGVKSATEAAEAQAELSSAGFEYNEVLKGTPAALNLSIAGQLNLRDTTKLLTGVMSAFKLSAEDVVRVTDIMAHTVANARTNLGELGPAFRSVSAVAHAAGVELETVASMIASLRTQGFTAEQTGTALRNFILILQRKPGEQVLNTLKEMGLTFEELYETIQSKGPLAIFDLFKERGIGLGESARIFGLETAAQVTALLTEVDSIRDFENELKNLDGTAERMAGTMSHGLPGSFAIFKNTVNGLMLTLGDKGLTSHLDSVSKQLANLIGWLRESEGPWISVILFALKWGPILLFVGIGLKIVAFFFGGLNLLIKGGLALRTAMIALDKKWLVGLRAQLLWIKLVTAAQWLWNIAMTANPIGLLIVGVAALIAILAAAAYFIYKFRDAIVGAFKSAWEWIENNTHLVAAILLIFGPLGLLVAAGLYAWKFRDEIISAFNSVVDFFSGLPGKMGDIFKNLWNGIVRGFVYAINKIIELWNNFKLSAKVPNWIPVIGGKELSFDTPNIPNVSIPGLQHGGKVVSPGHVLVGESGPEILNLPTGARVIPLAETSTMFENIISRSFSESEIIELSSLVPNVTVPHVNQLQQTQSVANGFAGERVSPLTSGVGGLEVSFEDQVPIILELDGKEVARTVAKRVGEIRARA